MKAVVGTFACAVGVAACVHGAARGADRFRALEPPSYAIGPPPGSDVGSRPFPGPPPYPPRPEPGQDAARGFEPPGGRVCFDSAETREKIVTHRLADPFHALRDGRLQGEALRAKLCRWRPGEFIYEVAVLLRDGRVVHIYMNAQTGQTIGVLAPRR